MEIRLNSSEIIIYFMRVYCFLSPSVQDVLGYSPKDILGKSCYEFIHPEDRENMMESYDQGTTPHRRNIKQ